VFSNFLIAELMFWFSLFSLEFACFPRSCFSLSAFYLCRD